MVAGASTNHMEMSEKTTKESLSFEIVKRSETFVVLSRTFVRTTY